MSRKIVINSNSALSEASISKALKSFEESGRMIGDGKRNVIKILNVEGVDYNIKSFKIPNLVNKIVYNFFRKSKAERSYLYGSKLLSMGVHTPHPEAYVEDRSGMSFDTSYYISKQLKYDYTIRKFVDDPEAENFDAVIRAFTRFTYDLHEKGIHFLDHSPGNTLITETAEGYRFSLVDLNRMNFETMSFDMRMNNFARLSPKSKMLDVLSDEYAKLIDRPYEEVRSRMAFYSQKFSSSFRKREDFKKQYYFWRKKR